MAAASQSSSERPDGSAGYFGLFGLPETFAVDPAALEAAYLARSREVHPDRFVQAPGGERLEALQRSRILNDAYKALKKPVPRAEYLLERHGVTIGDHERLDDAAFLMEILELREELGEARAKGVIAEVSRLEGEMKRRHRALVDQLAPAFAEVERGDTAALATIKRTLIELRYVGRYLEECAATLDAEDA